MKFLVETSSTPAKVPQNPEVKLAQSLARCSNHAAEVRKIHLNIYNSFEAKVAIYLSTYFKPWETDSLIRHIAQMAYSRNYQGEWKTVQELLETELQTPEQYRKKFFELRSAEEFYGNILRLAQKFVDSRRFYITDEQKEKVHRVKRPQRHRGYRDKGSGRLPHEKHGEPPVKPDREDRRPLVNHPLLREFCEFSLIFNLSAVPVSTSRKGG